MVIKEKIQEAESTSEEEEEDFDVSELFAGGDIVSADYMG